MSIPSIASYAMPNLDNYETNKVSWCVEPSRAVLLVHDMQYYFLKFYESDSLLLRKLLERISCLLGWARQNGVPVYYSAQPKDQSVSERALLTDFWGAGLTTENEQLSEIHESVAPEHGEKVIRKWRYSAFKRSCLRDDMVRLGRDQLLIAGVYSHIGCLATCLDAFMMDIYPFFIGDAQADFSEADHWHAMGYVSKKCGMVISTKSVLA